MADEKQIIHIRIRDLRRQHSLTQEELAEALGVSRQSINAMEAGRCLPSIPVALQMASYFAVPLHAIFALEEQVAAAERALALPTNSLSMSSPLQDMREAIDQLMDEGSSWSLLPQVTTPAINLFQEPSALVVQFCLPGYAHEQLSIEVGDDFLTVSCDARPEDQERQYIRREFAPLPFQRTISLPAMVEGSKAEAEMKAGILTIRVPKVIEEKPKTARITIKFSE